MAFSQSNVSSYVVDLTRVTRTGTVARDPVQDSRPPAQQSSHPSAPLRRIYERPSTACSKPQRWVLGASEGAGGCRRWAPPASPPAPPPSHLPLLGRPPRVKQNSESERRSPSSEDDRDERESRAEIQNAEDYNEIFQPKNSISEALPSPPFPSLPSPTIPLWDAKADGPFQDGVHVAAPP